MVGSKQSEGVATLTCMDRSLWSSLQRPQESHARGGQIGQFADGQIFIERMVIFGHHGGTSRGFPAGV